MTAASGATVSASNDVQGLGHANAQSTSVNSGTSVHAARLIRPGNGEIRHLVDPAGLARCMRLVVEKTSGVLTGGSPDELIRPFLSPNAEASARVLSRAVAHRLATSEERRPNIVMGIGVHGGIFAFLVVEALIELGYETAFVGAELGNRAKSEECRLLCPDDQVKANFTNSKVVVALPILTDTHVADVCSIKTFISGVKCVARIVGVVTIIQYGDVSLPQVDSLVKIIT